MHRRPGAPGTRGGLVPAARLRRCTNSAEIGCRHSVALAIWSGDRPRHCSSPARCNRLRIVRSVTPMSAAAERRLSPASRRSVIASSSDRGGTARTIGPRPSTGRRNPGTAAPDSAPRVSRAIRCTRSRGKFRTGKRLCTAVGHHQVQCRLVRTTQRCHFVTSVPRFALGNRRLFLSSLWVSKHV
jgi:hypothetical protein